MIVYRFRKDMVFDCSVELPDSPTIPPYHTFQAPPEKEGHYAIMDNGWKLVAGEKPEEPKPQVLEMNFPISLQDKIYGKRVNYENLIQKTLDDFAKTKSYSDILSAISYSESSVDNFRIEGTYCKNMRDIYWSTFYSTFEKFEKEELELPNSYIEFLEYFPKLEWPTN